MVFEAASVQSDLGSIESEVEGLVVEWLQQITKRTLGLMSVGSGTTKAEREKRQHTKDQT